MTGADRPGPFRLADLRAPLPAAAVDEARSAAVAAAVALPTPAPQEVLALVTACEDARRKQEWKAPDALRGRIEALSWQVQDTLSGPNIMSGVGIQ